MDTPARRWWGREGLGFWLCGPLLVLVALVQYLTGLPTAECGEGGGPSSAQETTAAIVVALASLAVFGAAVARLVALRRRSAWNPHRSFVGLGLGAVLLAGAIGWIVEGEFVYFVADGLIAGLALTGLALVVLVFAWAGRRSVDEVGSLLPLYLLGAGLFGYPLLLLLFAIANSGLGC